MAVGGEAGGMRKEERKSQLRCHRHQPPACRGLMAPCPAPALALSPGLRHIHCLLMVWSQKPALLGSDPPSRIPLCQSQTQSLCNRFTWFGLYILRNCTLVQFYLSFKTASTTHPHLHNLKLSQWLNVVMSSWTISHTNIQSASNVSGTLYLCSHRLIFSQASSFLTDVNECTRRLCCTCIY